MLREKTNPAQPSGVSLFQAIFLNSVLFRYTLL